MSQQSENLDFSGLFKLDVLIQHEIVNHTFYEVGLKKFLTISSGKELVFLYINSQSERFDNVYDWDFVDNPVYCMCFEPSGTWVLIVSDQKVLLVPFLPRFVPQNTFDCKWSLSSVTALPFIDLPQPTSVVWWLTKESENIIIIANKLGTITFYSLETQSIVGETRVSEEIVDLQICFDDSLDLLALLISKGPTQQWKLVLEHRSFGYNWLQQVRAQTDKEKKDGFMSYIKQLSKDKITFFTQGGSKDENKTQAVEYVLKPTDYIPNYRKNSNSWALTAQYVNGRHFLTAFELNEGVVILESPADVTPSRTLRPQIKKDGLYIQGLWSQRLVYLLRKNELEIHSVQFAQSQNDPLHGTKRDFSQLWYAELIGDVQRAYIMSAKEPASAGGGWKEPTFMCDLQLPRFTLEPCLVVTTRGAYVLNTVSEPSEWLVGLIMRGGVGAELSAAALGAPVPALLRAAADMLLSRGKIAAAQYLYSLSQSQPDGWVARLGVFGRFHELSMYKQVGNVGSLSNAAITAKLLALLLKIGTNSEENFDMEVKFTTLNVPELQELTAIAAAIGLWDLVPVFSIHRGHPSLLLNAIKSRSDVCRGAIMCLLKHKCLVPILLEENGQWFFDFIIEKCNKFDTIILKRLCLWLNPLQDQLRPVMRDLKQGITSIYATRMLQLISTFMHVACVIELRNPCLDIQTDVAPEPDTWKNQFTPRRSVSGGLGHWAVADDGNAKIMVADTPVNTELIGMVVDVACGRHHTLLLTENGIYAAGDNSFGQLGVGAGWRGAAGDAASAAGALLPAVAAWGAPLAAVAAGHYHSAAVDVGGRLYTWGWGVHGQLCLGNIDDQFTPQLVTKFQGRKVLSVGCGACHTVVLMRNGEVWAGGAGVFGQLGGGARDKASVPLRVPLADPVDKIAVGYFHNLALSAKGQLWCWGASPQQVRATQPRRSASPTSAPLVAAAAAPDPHLSPQLVDIGNVKGKILQLSAGWHHSCIVNNVGTIYSWGLNFDGQLGSGDRKPVQIPTEVKVRTDTQPDGVRPNRSPDKDNPEAKSKALIACGGDFTVYIDDDGRVYATGNMHLQSNSEKEKTNNRVIMMKTTKRVIKIPANRTNNKFLFQAVDWIDIMFPFDVDGVVRNPIEPRLNPLRALADFKKKSWPDDLIVLLKPWINEESLHRNPNMAAKLAYHRNMYADCLRFMLDNLKRENPEEQTYLTHHADSDVSNKKDELKIIITNVMSKRIKDISLSILNEEAYPLIDSSVYQSLLCCCDELKYTTKKNVPSEVHFSTNENYLIHKSMTNIASEINLSTNETQIIPKSLTNIASEVNMSTNETQIIPKSMTNIASEANLSTNKTEIIPKSMTNITPEVNISTNETQITPKPMTNITPEVNLSTNETQIIPKSMTNITPEVNLSTKAAQIIDKCISIFPVDSALWETCFRLAKDFYLENNLVVGDLEAVLRKYMETNANTMAAAIMYSNDCAQYSEILSPKFYLNMCSEILDTWG